MPSSFLVGGAGSPASWLVGELTEVAGSILTEPPTLKSIIPRPDATSSCGYASACVRIMQPGRTVALMEKNKKKKAEEGFLWSLSPLLVVAESVASHGASLSYHTYSLEYINRVNSLELLPQTLQACQALGMSLGVLEGPGGVDEREIEDAIKHVGCGRREGAEVQATDCRFP